MAPNARSADLANDLDVEVVEVAPRDGLQNFTRVVDSATKVALILRCLEAGIRRIEVASFVHPKYVPTMADAEEIVAALPDTEQSFVGLALNERGIERAVKTKVDEINVVVCATEAFSERNQGMSVEDSLRVVATASEFVAHAGRRLTVTVAVAFGCPFEGEVAEGRVAGIVERVAAYDPSEIALADTIGVAVPSQVRRLFGIVGSLTPLISLRAHFHNTRNTGLANAYAAIEAGVLTLDASLGGLGGCPFAPNATGNIATEDLLYMLDRMGIRTGVSLPMYLEASRWLEASLGTELPGLVARAGPFPESSK